MPTYTNPQTVHYSEAGVNLAAGETKTTPKTLTEVIITLPSAVDGLGMELVTEATTGKTGRIFWVEGATIGLVDVSGAFDGDKALSADVTGALGTPASTDDVQVMLTRTADTNCYSQLVARQDVTATAAGTEDVYLRRGTTWVMVIAVDVALVIKNGDSADEVIELPSGVWLERNESRYQHLQIEFSDAGTAKVLEFEGDFNPLAYSELSGGGGSGINTLASTVDEVNEAQRTTCLNTDHDHTVGPLTLIDSGSPQTLTGTSTLAGYEVDVSTFKTAALWVVLDINDSTDVELKVKALHTFGGSEEFDLPIQTVSASAVAIEDQVFIFTDDADQLKVIPIELDNTIKSIKVYIKAGTVGSTAGILTSLYVTRGY